MVLQCDWAVVQIIQLTNDGTGFGFGISGSRNSGAVVRNIFPGGAADREGHLQNGDHLLQVGEVRLWGMGAEQVASILRQAGQDSIRVVVARPVDPNTPNLMANCALVPTKSLSDPLELNRALAASLAPQVVNIIAGVPSLQPLQVPVTITEPTPAPSCAKVEAEMMKTQDPVQPNPTPKVLTNITNSLSKPQDITRSVSFQNDPDLTRLVKSCPPSGLSGSTPALGLDPLEIPKSASNPISLYPTLQKDMYPPSTRSEEKPNTTSSPGLVDEAQPSSTFIKPGAEKEKPSADPHPNPETDNVSAVKLSLHVINNMERVQRDIGLQTILSPLYEEYRSESNPGSERLSSNSGTETFTPGPLLEHQARVGGGELEGVSGGEAHKPDPSLETEEREIVEIRLEKDERGLGLTVAGYICEKASLCGIFVKGVVQGSVADTQGNIKPNDQVIEVNGEPLSGYSNQEAVELLKRTGQTVFLKIYRYPGGLKFEQLQDGTESIEGSGSDIYTSSSEMELPISTSSSSEREIGTPLLSTLSSRGPMTPTSMSSSKGQSTPKLVQRSNLPHCSSGSSQDQDANIFLNNDDEPINGGIRRRSGGNSLLSSSRTSLEIEVERVDERNFCSRNTDSLEFCSECSKDQDCSSLLPNSSSIPSSRFSSYPATHCTFRSCSCRARCSSCSSIFISPEPLEHEDGEDERGRVLCNVCLRDQEEETREIIIDHSSIVDEMQVEKCMVTVLPGFQGEYSSPIVELNPDYQFSRDLNQPSSSFSQLRCPDYPLLHVAPLDEVGSQHQPFPLDDIQFVDDDKDDSEIIDPSTGVYSGSGLTQSSSLQPNPGTELSGNRSTLPCRKSEELKREVRTDFSLSPEPLGAREGLQELEKNWAEIMGSGYDIIAAVVEKDTGSGLGISLEGTVDIEDGREVRPHHYIRTILPYGPVDSAAVFRSGDQLIQVNSFSLVGVHHEEVVRTLKQVGNTVVLVCARRTSAPGWTQLTVNLTLDPRLDKSVHDPSLDKSVLNKDDAKISPTLVSSDSLKQNSCLSKDELEENILSSQLNMEETFSQSSLVKAKSDLSLNSLDPSSSTQARPLLRSKSLESVSPPGVWSNQVEEIVLVKAERGLGFSILDYQDPSSLSDTVIVVRSLVPGGPAYQDGRLIPGDRIVYVNSDQLNNSSLDTAVQALKGAECGLVRIGVCKPICPKTLFSTVASLEPEDIGSRDKIAQDPSLEFDSSDLNARLLPLPVPCPQTGSTDTEQELISFPPLSAQPVPGGSQGFPSLENPRKRLKPQTLDLDVKVNQPYQRIVYLDPEPGEKFKSEPSCVILPTLTKYSISVKKQRNESLGLVVEALAWDLCGCMAREIQVGSPVCKDGRIRLGDMVISVNGENLWRVTSIQAQAVLNRTVPNQTVQIIFIPEEDLNTEEPNLSFGSSSSLPLSDILEQAESELSDSDHGGIFSPDLTVKSAATPDFLLENLPETVIDWVEEVSPNPEQDLEPSQGVLQPGVVPTSNKDGSENNRVEKDGSVKNEVGKNGAKKVENCVETGKGKESPNLKGSEKKNCASVNPKEKSLINPIWEHIQPSSDSQHSVWKTNKPVGGRDGTEPRMENMHSQVEKGKHWGPKRLVEVCREAGQPLGISIVGGKVEMTGAASSSVAGIFIKNVIPASPAGRTGDLSTGDRIVEVDGVPLLTSDQDIAVAAIAKAGNPIRFIVQSLQKHKVGEGRTDINHINHTSVDEKVGKVPAKLIIPDIFFGTPKPNGPTSNGFSTRSSSSSNNEKREETSFEEDKNGNPGNPGNPEGQIQMNSLTDNIPLIDDDGDMNQEEEEEDRTMLQSENSCSALSTPEVMSNEQSYNYSKVTERPLVGNNLNELRPVEDYSMRSDRSASPPPEPELIQAGLTDQEKQDITSKMDVAKREERTDWKGAQEHENEEPVECMIVDNKIVDKKVILRKASIKSEHGGNDSDDDDDDDMTEEKNWAKLDGEVIKIIIEPNEYGLGLSLAGHRHRETMRTYICGLHPRGKAFQDGTLKAGDQLLKVGEYYVGDRCHLNVTTIIKGYSTTSSLEIVVLRSPTGLDSLAVKPINKFPLLLDDMIFESEEFQRFVMKRELKVHKGKQGLGIMIIEGQHKATGNGIFVSDIQAESAAFHAGLKVGDMILAINTETFINISYDTAVSVIKSLGGNVKMLVTSPKEEEENKNKPGAKPGLTPRREGDSKTPAQPGATKAAAEPVKVEPVKPKEDLTGKVDLKKENGGYGLSLVGGVDTPLGEVLIHEIFPESAAAKSGVLRPGDRINKINEVELKGLTHDAALDTLRSTIDKAVLHFEHRDGDQEIDLFQQLDITLNRKPGKGIGISLVGRRDGPGVFVSALVSGSLAEASGQLVQGDQIIKVNEIDLEKANQDTAVAVLKAAVGDIKIKVKRLNAITKS